MKDIKQSDILDMVMNKLKPEESGNKLMNLLTLLGQQQGYQPMAPQNEAMPQPQPTQANIGAQMSSLPPEQKYKFLRKGQV
jgi:hypothetical protein